MTISEDFNSWTFATIIEIVHTFELEPATFDYKAYLNVAADRREYKSNLCQTICGMANANGGYILFGITDRKKGNIDDPAKRIEGIPIQGDLAKEFGEKLSQIQPIPSFQPANKAIPLPDNPERGIYVVYIPLSNRRPHMVTSTHIFYRRSDGGSSEPMSYQEVRDQMLLNEEKLRQVTSLRLELLGVKTVANLAKLALSEEKDHEKGILLPFDIHGFKALCANICGLIPINLSKELMMISFYMNMINRILEDLFQMRMNQGIDPAKPGSPIATGILIYLATLEKYRIGSEDSFNELFGPMASEGFERRLQEIKPIE